MSFDGFDLPAELADLRGAVRAFMRESVRPSEASLDPEATDLPDAAAAELMASAKDAGLWALSVPTRLSGGGMGAMARVVVLEELAQHRNGLYNPGYGAIGRYPPDPCYDCSDPQVERFLRPMVDGGWKTFFAMSEPTPAEPRGGADPAAGIETTAVRKGDTFVINGTKTWISNGHDAVWGIVFARTTGPDGVDGVSAFFVEHGQFTATRLAVIRPDSPCELSFEDCEVSGGNLLGDLGAALPKAREMLTRNRIWFAAAHVGVAVAAQEYAAEQCRARTHPLAWTIADSALDIEAARHLVWDAAWRLDTGCPYKLAAAQAKLFSSEALVRCVDRAIQILGGWGVSKELPLERWYREARGRLVAAGPSEAIRAELAAAAIEPAS